MSDPTNGTNPPANSPAVSSAATPSADDLKLRGVSRSLLIGVGGTGHKILLDVRQRLLQKYGSLDKLPIVSFLLLDTDQSIFNKNPNYSDAANLDNADKIHCSVYGVENLRRKLGEYPYLLEWLDPKTLSGDIHQGAGAVRARGRLAYFWNYNTIARRIDEEYQEVTKDSSKAQAIKNGLQVSEGVTVYIVGSLLGGTGSGMFLDLAYTVKELLKTQRMLEVVGVFSIPPNTSAVAVDNRPNAYASMLELNHYTDTSTTFTAQYQKKQPGIGNGQGNADPPFRYTYLVDTSSPSANLGSVDKMVEMIGHSLFLDLTSEFQRQKKSNRDNFDQFLTNPDDLGCPQNYLSMGLAAIHFPKDKVLQACASRLARQIIQRWTEPLDRNVQIPAFTRAEIARLGLDVEEIKRQILVANAESGELLRDTAIAHWNNANRQYETSFPGNARVVEFLSAKQGEQAARMVDTDANPDLRKKSRQHLGEYYFQIQENLVALIPAKEQALRSFVSECVNNPNRRHGVARAFLEAASKEFVVYAAELSKQRDASKETLVPCAEQRDAQLGDITRLSGDMMLSLIMGAKKREIDEKKDTYLNFARRWDTTTLDIRAADSAIYFYNTMAVILETLKAELDVYIERMKTLEAHFRKEEQTAIENPVDVNGLVIFDRGRRVELENGLATYVDGDIDQRYNAYVGDGTNPGNAVVGTAASDALVELGTTGNIYGLRGTDTPRVADVLFIRARRVFGPVENESVLDKFFEKYGFSTDRSVEELRRVFSLSQPFIHLQENAPDYNDHPNKEQTIVGAMHGSEARTEAQTRFLTMLRDTVQGIRDGQITNSNENHQILFLRERAAFPLRLLEGMEAYRFAYDQSRAQGATTNPIHTRRDVREWIRIDPPSYTVQMAAWQTFCVGWACEVITEEHEKKYAAAANARTTTRFSASYRDRFGMPKTDLLGTFHPIISDMAKLMRESLSSEELAAHPPQEAREIVLLLCDQPTLKEHLDQSIELKLHELGVTGMGDVLVRHVQQHALPGAQHLEAPIYRPYQKAIQDYLEQINYDGSASAVTPITPAALPAPALVYAAGSNGGVAADANVAVAPAAAGSGLQGIRQRLADIKGLLEDGLINEDDFNKRKAEILKET